MTARNALLATFAIALFHAPADARPRPGGHIGGRRFDANKTFGVGLELGAPTGIVGKYFLSSDRALDFGVGDIYNYFDRYGLHIYADYLFHPVSLVSAAEFELPLYVGLGGRFWSFEDRGAPGGPDDAYALGFRVPVGIAFDFNNVPLDIFVQVIPVFDLFFNYGQHSAYLDINASVGIRYWFN
jgi:hypothetical protein